MMKKIIANLKPCGDFAVYLAALVAILQFLGFDTFPFLKHYEWYLSFLELKNRLIISALSEEGTPALFGMFGSALTFAYCYASQKIRSRKVVDPTAEALKKLDPFYVYKGMKWLICRDELGLQNGHYYERVPYCLNHETQMTNDYYSWICPKCSEKHRHLEQEEKEGLRSLIRKDVFNNAF